MNAIISLVLLDSRSLSDTLGELLAQRTKSIQAFFSSSNKNEIQENGEAESPENKRTRSQRVRDAKRIFRQAIDLLAETVHTVRSIYSTSSNSSHSTIQSLLVEIQSDADESLISTRKVLNALPSASLLDLYLPPSIKSYTHFIDTTGPSFQISPAFVSSKLETWFKKGLDAFNSRSKYWIDMLDSATDVEKVRISVLTSPSLQHLSTQEKEILTRYIGETCNNRVTAIWKDAFVALHVSFEEALTKAVGIIAQSGHETQLGKEVSLRCEPISHQIIDLNPSMALLSSRVPWPPSVRGNQSQSSIDTAFSKFDAALRIRRTNRTPLLESILVIVETRLKEFHSELDAIASTKDATKHTFLTQILPLEDQIFQSLISSMEKAAKTDQESSQISKIGPVIFVGRVAAELGNSLALSNNTTTRGGSVASKLQSFLLFVSTDDIFRIQAICQRTSPSHLVYMGDSNNRAHSQ
ncbi:hypothetical protein FRB91_002211 [Serendipita sp. 411]|nr:hypothetical protein FRB91_002211 [Serendipita sp. 411]